MKTRIIILSFTFFYFLSLSNAQSLSDTLSFEKLPFYGNSITLNGKHIGLSKVRKLTINIPGELQHFKNINHIRIAVYPLAYIGGFLTGLGLGQLSNSHGDIRGQSIIFIIGGVATLFSVSQMLYLEKQEMKAIVVTYNKSLRQ